MAAPALDGVHQGVEVVVEVRYVGGDSQHPLACIEFGCGPAQSSIVTSRDDDIGTFVEAATGGGQAVALSAAGDANGVIGKRFMPTILRAFQNRAGRRRLPEWIEPGQQ